MESVIDLLRQENARLMARITGLESEKAELLKQVAEEKAKHEAENAELKSRIEELEKGRTDTTDAIAKPLSQSKISEEKRIQSNFLQDSGTKTLDGCFTGFEHNEKAGAEVVKLRDNNEQTFLQSDILPEVTVVSKKWFQEMSRKL
jgi:hypothetical protein